MRSQPPTLDLDLHGRTALVTGSAKNIGRDILLAFAKHGAAVASHARADSASAEAVAEQARAFGARAIAVQGDIADENGVRQIFDRVVSELGAVDILVNCAAIRPRSPFLELTGAEWRSVMGVNLDGAFYCSRAAAPGMAERGWGRIINIGGGDGFRGKVKRAHVAAAKAGLHGLTRTLALELGEFGITVNTVVPGYIDTPRDAEWYKDFDAEGRKASIPLRRLGHPTDISAACLYLVTLGSYVTGQALHVNGGGLFG